MTWQSTLITLGKLLVCIAAFAAGLVLGGMLTTALNLPAPAAAAPRHGSRCRRPGHAARKPALGAGPDWPLPLITGPLPACALMLAWFTWISNT